MNLVVISPDADDPRELPVVGELFAAGLGRYHVRKPEWPAARLADWLRAVSAEWRPRLVLHSHHELAAEFGVGGVHFRDDMTATCGPEPTPGLYRSRACHDLAGLRSVLARYDSVLFAPVFPSVSKPGHGPRADFPWLALSAMLATRTDVERRTSVLALGGITIETAPRALALGFDGVAVLGALWQSADPVKAFRELQRVVAAASTSEAPTVATSHA